MRQLIKNALTLSASLFLMLTPLRAAEKPLWEVGVGAAALSFPAYRGSDQTNNFMVPVPLFSYHGDFFKADRHGIRGSFFDSDFVDLTISLALSPPGSSSDIKARSGMSDLEATFELGPQVDLTFWRSENRARFFKLLMPLRTAITVEGSPQSIGWVFHPKLNVDITDLPGLPGWNLGLLAGPLFGDRRQNSYYYTVAPQFATAERPAYEASSGFAGMQYVMGFSKRFSKYWVGTFLRYDNLSGASFEHSPLVKQKDYFAGGVAITWVFGESSTRVQVND